METYAAGKYESETVREVIDEMARTRGEAIFLISPETGRTLTFAGLQKQSKAIAARFQERGLKYGDNVAFLLDNGLFSVQLFLGTMYAGLVTVPLNVRGGASQLTYTLDHCDAKVIFVEEQYRALAQEIVAGIKRTVQMISADIDAFADECGTTFEDTQATKPVANDVALLMYTSGSVGRPKAAIHSHRTVLAHGRNSICSHQLTTADRSLLVLPLYHINAECVTLMPTLLSGGSVVVPHHFSVSQFWDQLDEYRCTWSAVVPTIIAQLLDWKDPHANQREIAFQRVRFLRSSSAPLSPSLQREFLNKFNLLLIQAMGSSEAGNIFSNPLPPGENKIGSPGLPWGFETRIIDPNGDDVAPGAPGEVLIRGTAMTQGYYKDADQTTAVFDAAGWLHTGDLAYRDQDGYFFIVGRSKELIIKGGVNIAPRQIDEVLESHPAVLEAAVVGVPDQYLGEDLVAFVVLRSRMEGDERQMLDFCESRLGHFKTPTRIHFVTDLPKGPSGKVQRLRLLEEHGQPATVETASSNGHSTNGAMSIATTALEQTIVASWSEVLKQPQVESDSNFFSLGGHSLMAIQCLSKLRDKLPVPLSLSDFFENPTVSRQVALITNRLSALGRNGNQMSRQQSSLTWERSRPQQLEPAAKPQVIPARGKNLPYPLSSGQQRIWFFEELVPGVPLYNESECVRLVGELRCEELEQALNLIIARHEILRTTILTAAERPIAIVLENWRLRMKRIDLSDFDPAQRETELSRLLIEEPRHPYHLDQEPGIRVTLVRLSPKEHVLILMMHHLVCDWASEGVLWRELSSAYRAISRGEPLNLGPLPIQYGDYAVWQQQRVVEGAFAEDLAFWQDNLRDAPELLDLPSDRPRPSVQSYRGARQRFRFNANLTEALRSYSREGKTSLFTVFAAAFNTLLYRYTGSEDILLGIPIAEREYEELQPIIGFLIHTQILRTQLSGSMTFRELLACVQKATVGLYTHREVPFDQVVSMIRPERSLSSSPLFQVMFNWRDRDQHLSFIGLDGLVVESLLSETRTSKFDLTLLLTDFGNEIWLEAEYNTDLFDDDRIARMFGHYQTLLDAVATGSDRRLAELPLLSDAEYRQLVTDSGHTQDVFPKDRCLHQMFEEQVTRTPEAVAVTFEDTQLSYRQLNERANQLAHHLRNLGVKAGDLVGICMERSLEMVVGLLGILKAGGAYVPLDPQYPHERLAFMLEDTQARVLVTLGSSLKKFPVPETQLVRLDSDCAEIERQSIENPPSDTTPDHLAYVIYTSGSTGKPKGVAITHYNVVRLFQSTEQWFQFNRQDVWTLFHSFAFDFSVWEIWGALLHGGRLVVVPYLVSRSPEAFYQLLSHERVTVLNQTPSAFMQLMEFEANIANPKKLALRLIIFGGEALDVSSLAPWFDRHGDAHPRLVNMYGITETTVHVTYRPLLKTDLTGGSCIGQPIPDLQLYILDKDQQPVPIGIAGEICVGGAGLAQGYVNRPELTALRFIPNPLNGMARTQLYRSGDLARYLPNKDVEYLGRIDQQVKIRGFRIELEEIEATLKLHPGVARCVVAAREDKTGNKQLVAYIVPLDQRNPPSLTDLRDFIRLKLPDYMVPVNFMMLAKLPLTSNGKIDRKMLPTVEVGLAISAADHVAPRTPVEQALAEIWCEVLSLKEVGTHDDFFALGGHSLQAIQLLNKVDKSLNRKLSVPEFFQNSTIEGMAKAFQETKRRENEHKLVPLKAGNSEGSLFFLDASIGMCRIAQLLNVGPASFATGVPLPSRALQAAALDRLAEMPSLETLAAGHAALIRSRHKSGPCLLAGYCFGGVLAFEVAHQLIRTGISVEMIILLDSWARVPLWWEKLKALSSDHRRPLSLRAGHLWSKVPAKLSAGISRLTPSFKSDDCSISEQSKVLFGEDPSGVFLEFLRSLRLNYRYRELDSHAVLFRCQDDLYSMYAIDGKMGWGGLFSRGIEIVETPGNHSSMLLEPGVQELAKKIDERLEQLLENKSMPFGGNFPGLNGSTDVARQY